MFSEACPDFEAIVEYSEGSLPWDEFNAIEEHLVFCESCRFHLISIKEQPDQLFELIHRFAGTKNSDDEETIRGTINRILEFKDSPPKESGMKIKYDFQTEKETNIGGYRILREISRGGMGVVYEAEDTSLHRTVALKVMLFSNLHDEFRIKRFEREAQAAASLHHEHIVPVFSCGQDKDVFYYAMQKIEGMDLGKILNDRKLEELKEKSLIPKNMPVESCLENRDEFSLSPSDQIDETVDFQTTDNNDLPSSETVDSSSPKQSFNRNSYKYRRNDNFSVSNRVESIEQIVRVGITVAQTLEHAHNNGILHRDIKPSNLIIDENGKVWVTDFGVAKIITDEKLSHSNDYAGTLKYMSPERISGDKGLVDQRTDIYSLGLTLYESLTLVHPFSSSSPIELIKEIDKKEPAPLRKIRTDIPVDLESVIMKSIAKDPAERYLTASSFAADLQRFLERKPVLAKKPSLSDKMFKWIYRNKKIASVLFFALIFVLIGYVFYAAQLNQYYGELKRTNESLENSQNRLRESMDLIQSQKHKIQLQLYASDMKLANQALENRDIAGMKVILEKYIPANDQEDIRGFEWEYLDWNTRVDHQAFVELPIELYAMSISPDKKQIAIGGMGSVFRIFNTETGKEILDRFTDQIEINGLGYSPDGKLLATIGNNGTVQVWDLHQVKQIVNFKVTPEIGYAVVFSPDGTQLITSGNEPVVHVWDWKNAKKLKTLKGHERSVEGLDVSPDQNLLATACDDGHVRLWNTQTWEILKTIYVGYDRLTCIDFSYDGRLITAGDVGGLVFMMDVDSGKEVSRFRHPDGITSVQFSPDASMVTASDRSGTIKCWRLQSETDQIEKEKMQPGQVSGQKPLSWKAHGNRVAQVLFLNSEDIITTGWDGKLVSWSPFQKKMFQEVDNPEEEFHAYAILPDHNHFSDDQPVR